MKANQTGDREQWIEKRLALLEREKELTRLSDEIARERQALPWVELDKSYEFDGPDGRVGMADLFDGRGQLLVYHFMFGADWEEGCKSCSFWADGYAGTVDHLAARDVTLVAISSGLYEKLAAFKKRMGWGFDWYSSAPSTFSRDFHVSYGPEDLESGDTFYNFKKGHHYGPEAPGLSVFAKDDAGTIYHTYSAYARGLDIFNSAYQLLDRVPLGRNEAGLEYSMAWVKHRDRYGEG